MTKVLFSASLALSLIWNKRAFSIDRGSNTRGYGGTPMAARTLIDPGCWPSGTKCTVFSQKMVYCCPGGTTQSESDGWCIGYWDAPPCDPLGEGGGGGGGGGGGFCFSTDATVSVKGKGIVPIMDVALNDQVLSNVDGQYSKVYAFGNRNKNRQSSFTRIETAATTIDLTPDHMLYLADRTKPVTAFSVKVGDTLRMAPDAKMSSKDAIVQKVTHDVIKTTGFITPVTVSGTIIVNGVMASNYAGKHGSGNYFGNDSISTQFSLHYHDVSHVAVAPLRFVCTKISPSFCSLAHHHAENDDSEDRPGQHCFFATVHSLKHFVASDACGPLLHVLLFAMVVGTGLFFFLLERGVVFLVVAVAAFFVTRSPPCHKKK